jgi:hypothetical protein
VQHVERIGEIRNANKTLVAEPEVKVPLGRSGSRWDDNITVGLKELGLEGLNWDRLSQDRDRRQAVLNTIINVRVT